MSGYVGKLQIGANSNDLVAFGDVLYGTCRTAAATAAKVLENNVTVNNSTWNDFPVGFGQLMDGIQVRIKFIYGNTATSGVTLKILGTNALSVVGDCRCKQNEVIIFTFEENVGGQSYWRVTGGGISSSIQQYVSDAVSQITSTVDSMVFKGTIGSAASNATINTLPTSGYKAGWTYKVITPGNYGTQQNPISCEQGDLIIAIANAETSQSALDPTDWTVAQGNLDGAVTGPVSSTANHIAIFSGTTGDVIQDSGYTIETSVPANAVFTDTDTNTSYQYTLTNGDTAALTACDALGTSDTGGTVLATVDNGVLKLEKGIKFTTTTYSLSPSAVAGPSLT